MLLWSFSLFPPNHILKIFLASLWGSNRHFWETHLYAKYACWLKQQMMNMNKLHFLFFLSSSKLSSFLLHVHQAMLCGSSWPFHRNSVSFTSSQANYLPPALFGLLSQVSVSSSDTSLQISHWQLKFNCCVNPFSRDCKQRSCQAHSHLTPALTSIPNSCWTNCTRFDLLHSSL